MNRSIEFSRRLAKRNLIRINIRCEIKSMKNISNRIGLRNRIWEDLYDSKKSEEFLSLYLASKKNNKTIYDVTIATISILGAILTTVQNQFEILKNSAFIACLIIIIVQLADKALPNLLIKDDVINKLSEYRIKYVTLYENLDLLWCEFEDQRINYDEAFERYFSFRKLNIALQELDNSVLIKENKRLNKIAEERAQIHMDKHFYQCNNEQETSIEDN